MVRRKRSGFTLTEAVITVAILGIVSSISAKIMIQANRYFILTRTRRDLQGEARGVMYVITRNLREAQNATITIDRLSTSQPFCSRITFTKIQGTTMTFEQSGNQLIQVVGGKSHTLSKNLRYLAFSFPRSDDMTIVSVSMTLEEGIFQGQKKALHMASEKVEVMN